MARLLRRDPLHADAWICALSGYDSEGDRNRSAQAGFDHHFVKPLDPERLAETLSALAAARAGNVVAFRPPGTQSPTAATGTQ